MKVWHLITIISIWSTTVNLFAQSNQDYQTLRQLGRDALQEEKYEEALSFFDQALLKMPYYSQIWYERGQTKLNLKDYPGAVRDFGLAIQKNPYKTIWYLQRGIAYMNMQAYSLAQSDFEKVLQLSPNHALAMEYLQEVHQMEIEAIYGSQELSLTPNTSTREKDRLREKRRQKKDRLIWGVVVPITIFVLFNRWAW